MVDIFLNGIFLKKTWATRTDPEKYRNKVICHTNPYSEMNLSLPERTLASNKIQN